MTGERSGNGDASAPNGDDGQSESDGPDRNAPEAADSTPDADDAGEPEESAVNETVATAAPEDAGDGTGDTNGSADTGADGSAAPDAADTAEPSEVTDAGEAGDEPGEGSDRNEADGEGGDGSERGASRTAVAGTGEPNGGGNEEPTTASAADAGATDETASVDANGDDGDDANGDDEWQLGTILSGERLETWATAAADDVVGDRHEEINPSQHDPDRLERKVRRIDPDSMDDVERITSLSQEIFRRRKAYIAELETRLAALDERLEALEADYEQEVSQLNSLMDRKEDRIDELRTYGHESLVGPIVSEVRSDLVGAVSHDDPDAVREAAEYALDDLDDVLRAQDVSLIEPDEGDGFDRDAHRPVTRAEDHRPEGTVIDTQQPGFRIDGEVREKANVVISDGSGTPPTERVESDDGADGQADDEEAGSTDADSEANDESTAEPDDEADAEPSGPSGGSDETPGDDAGDESGGDGDVEGTDEVDGRAADDGRCEASGGEKPRDGSAANGPARERPETGSDGERRGAGTTEGGTGREEPSSGDTGE